MRGHIAQSMVISLSQWSYRSVNGHISQSVVMYLSRWSCISVGGHISQSVVIYLSRCSYISVGGLSAQCLSPVLAALPDLNSVHERRSRFVVVLFLFVRRGLLAEVLIYVHRKRRFIRDGSPGRLPRLSHSS